MTLEEPSDTLKIDPPDRNPGSSIIYQNASKDITLVDIPRSVELAQGSSTLQKRLVSSAALQIPYPSTEPKSDTAKANLHGNSNNVSDHAFADIVNKALAVISAAHSGDWCLPRISNQPAVPKKRKAKERADEDCIEQHDKPILLCQLASNIKDEVSTFDVHWSRLDVKAPDPSGEDGESAKSVERWARLGCNKTSSLSGLSITCQDASPAKFFIPGNSAFYMADCSDSTAFHAAVRNIAQDLDTRRQFDFILMDPPWPNKSVKNSRRTGRSSYETASSLWDMRALLFEMDIDVLLAKNGFVGIWITNKPAVRELVLGEDGLFESWGVQLQEEWIWIKTTAKGEPVTGLGGVWRKPYEILLVGRKIGYAETSRGCGMHDLKRRVIAGVPDLHSRKPCLKELIEPLMPNVEDYKALEIFARYLVTGWWSWGNEVLKFNHENCWVQG